MINRCEYDGVYDGLNENNKKNIEDKDLNNNKKQINKWKINQDFFIAIDNYIKFSVAYNKTQECLIVNDECEIEDDIDSIDG